MFKFWKRKVKVSSDELAEILSRFTIKMYSDSNFRSIFNKKTNEDYDFKMELIGFYMFIITYLFQKRKIPKEVLNLYHKKMYNEITYKNIIPEDHFIRIDKSNIHLPRETLLSFFEEELNEKYRIYYDSIKYLNDDNGAWEIGKIIVKNFGGDIKDPKIVLDAGIIFIGSIKHISKFLYNFKIK